MSYYADLSPYEYHDHDQPMLNVGWLDRDHPFPTGDVDADLAVRLLQLAHRHRRAIMRGVQDCHFCGAESPLRVQVSPEGDHTYLGTGEIRVESDDGTLFAAPTLVCHYMAAHGYLPPGAFLDAVRTGSPGPVETYEVPTAFIPELIAREAVSFRSSRPLTAVDIESVVKAFEAEVRSVRSRARKCVEQLLAMPDESIQYLFAERLGGLGSMIVPDLYELVLDEPEASPAQKYLAAWVAVRMGDRGPAVDHLCIEVTSGSPYALPAANALTRFGLTQGLAPMTTALEAVDPDDVTAVYDWAMALHDLGGELPEEVRRQLELRTSCWHARAVLASFREQSDEASPDDEVPRS